jgi:type I restriction enzyme S subunit
MNSRKNALVSIESLCLKVTSGGTPSRANLRFWEDGTIPWFKTGELKDWYLEDAEENINDDALSSSSAKLFPPDTVLMAMYGDGKTITTLGILRREAATNQACCALIVDPAICNSLYLFYALKHHRHELLRLVVAGAQRNLSTGIIRKFKIISHTLPIQRGIVTQLSAYDELIENNRRRIALLEDAAKHLYREWFVRLLFPGYEHTAKTNGVPDGWRQTDLGHTLTLKRGHDLPSAERVDGEIPIVSSSGITGFHNEKKATAPGVVTGRYGTIGEVYYVQQDYWPLNTALYVCDFKGNPPAYVVHLLKHVLAGTQSDKAAVPGVNRNVLHRIPILAPTKPLIDQFAEFAQSTYQQIYVLDTMNQKLSSARDLLLPRLMSGEIAV